MGKIPRRFFNQSDEKGQGFFGQDGATVHTANNSTAIKQKQPTK
jgi:hypothetical protein